MEKPNFIITIRYEIPTFSSVGPFFKEGGGGGLENFGQKLKFLGFFQLRSPLSQFLPTHPPPENRTCVISNLVSRNTNSAENLLTRESYSNFEL